MEKETKDISDAVPFIVIASIVMVVIFNWNSVKDFFTKKNDVQIEQSSSAAVTASIDPETELKTTLAPDLKLNDSVTGLEGDFQANEVNASIIGVEFGDKNVVGYGYRMEDASNSFLQGFNIGFNKNNKSSHDALLVLYVKAVVSQKITSPRDLQQFKPKLQIVDDKGDEGQLLYNSFSTAPYVNIGEERFGKFIWAVYSDSNEFHLTIENKKYLLKSPEFLKDVQK